MTTVDPASMDAKTANVLYHDWEAQNYDDRWSISFDERCVSYAREKFGRVAPVRAYGDVLEIGCGTGFFIINLWQAGLVERAYATDISAGMVEACRRNAERVGLADLEGKASDAESLPYDDDSFDLVVGHAVLHHIPDVPAALRECFRVLRPGGTLVIAGEPTRIGYQIVLRARRGTAAIVKAIARFKPEIRLPEDDHSELPPEAALEAHVDLHEFHPHMVRGWLREAGFARVNVRTEEFLSGMLGWSNRTVEAMVRPEFLGASWPFFAYHSYIALYRLDEWIVRRIVPKPLFYNVLLSATKPLR
ncbi:MAG TPA: methyltransferase domain-containing protein [Actinomycetota bacterium]